MILATGVVESWVDVWEISTSLSMSTSTLLLLLFALPGRRFDFRFCRATDSKVFGGQRGKSLSRSSLASTRCRGFSTKTTSRTCRTFSCRCFSAEDDRWDILPSRGSCRSKNALQKLWPETNYSISNWKNV